MAATSASGPPSHRSVSASRRASHCRRPKQEVIPDAAPGGIVVGPTEDEVVAVVAEEDVGAPLSEDQVQAITTMDRS